MKNMVGAIQAVCLLGIMMLIGCTSMSSSPLAPAQLDGNQDQVMIQVLHKRIHERERTIAQQNYQMEVMSSQLEALKRIDQDMREPRRPMRNSMTVLP